MESQLVIIMSNYKYIAWITDEWNNNISLNNLIFRDLNELSSQVKDYIKITYDKDVDISIQEYPSTLGWCFDTDIEIIPDETYIQVRGFIIDDDYLKAEVNRACAQEY